MGRAFHEYIFRMGFVTFTSFGDPHVQIFIRHFLQVIDHNRSGDFIMTAGERSRCQVGLGTGTAELREYGSFVCVVANAPINVKPHYPPPGLTLGDLVGI